MDVLASQRTLATNGAWRTGRRSLTLIAALGLVLLGSPSRAEAQIIVLPGVTQDFGPQLTNTTGNLSFAVTNELVSGGTLDITGITEIGGGCGEFAVTTALPINGIAEGASVNIDVTFTPTATVTSNCTLRFVSTDTVGGVDDVAVTGLGVEPDILVDTTPIDFGDQVLSTASAPAAVTITNNGTADLTVTTVALSGANVGDFATTASPPIVVSSGGGTANFNVTFTPTAINGRSASLDITSDDPDTPFAAIALSGNGVDPDIGVNMASIDFGNQLVSTTSGVVTLAIENNGTTDLTVSGIAISGTDAADFAATPLAPPNIVIGASSSANVDVTFTPSATGGRSAFLDITSDDPDTPVLSVPLSGDGIQQDISVNVASVDFGDQQVGVTSGTMAVTISNPGTATLSVNSIVISGTHAAEFSPTFSATPPFTINAGGSETVTLDFTPADVGGRTGSLDITSDDPDEPNISVSLTGNGIEQDIAVDMASVDFGNQPVSTTSGTTTVTISNAGTAALSIVSITLAGTNPTDFTATPSQTPMFSIAPGGFATVDLDFTPAAAGARSAILRIVSDDPDDAMVDIPLMGNGTEPEIAVNPTTISFGDQLLSTTSAATVVTIQNTGTGTLSVSNIALGATDPGDFAFVPSLAPPFSIAPGGSETVSVTFTPTAGGARASSLDITSDDADEGNLSIPLDGNGLFPDIAVDMAAVNFGDQLVGATSSAVVVTIDNNGTGILDINNISLSGTHAAEFSALPSQAPGFSIAAGGSATVTLDFTPAATGARTASLDILSSDPDTGTLNVPLTGNGVQQEIAVDMAAVNFGDQLVGATSGATTVTISNNGGFPLLITDISLAGTHPGDFSATPSMMPMFSIAAGGSETVALDFTPGALGGRSATLQISSDDPNTAVLSVPLSGNGVEPDISVNVASLDFGQILVGDTSTAQTVTIQNTGGWPLTINTANMFGGAAADYTPTPSSTLAHTLAPAESMTVDVTFTPGASGTRASTLQITSDDPDTPTASVTVTGDGMEAPQMILSTNNLDFGSQLTGSSTDLTFDISNGMGQFRFDLDATSITVNGDPDFSVNPTSALGIAPDGSVTITVTFVPQQPNMRMATIDIVSNDPNMSMQSVIVVGQGLEPDIMVNPDPAPDPYNFGNISVGMVSNTLTVTATNNGNSPLTITSAALATGTDFSVDMGNATATIPAGGNETWDITCRPTTTGVLNDSFVIASDDPDTPSFSLALECTGLDRPISLDPAASFPDTYIDDTSNLNIDIVNEQDAPVTITNITVNLSAFVVNAAPPYTLNPAMTAGHRQPISIDFTPPVAMPYSGLLEIEVAGLPTPVAFAIDGNGVVSELTITRQPQNDSVPVGGHDFGGVAVFFNSAPQTFRLESTGSAPLTITGVSIDDGVNFQLMDPTIGGPIALAPGQFQDFTITGNPLSMGMFSGQVTVQSDIPNAMYSYFNVVVEGTTGVMDIDPLMVDFGPVDVQDTASLPRTQTVRVTNLPDSNDDLTIADIRIDGNPAYNLPSAPPSTVLAIGASIDIEVAYTPTVESFGDGANLVLVTDAAVSGTVSVPLAGRGIDRHIQVTPMSVQFPETVRNPETPAQETITVENTGDAPLAISMLMTGGPDASVYRLSSDVMLVNPQESEQLVVEFIPDAINPDFAATLTIVNDDSDAPMVDVDLSGPGVVPDIALVAGAMNQVMETGQGVPLRLSSMEAGPLQLMNLDSGRVIRVSDIRVVDDNGDPLEAFSVVDFQPDVELSPQDALNIDIELLSDTPGTHRGTVQVYLGADPVAIGQLEITGEVFAIELRGGCDAAHTGDSEGRLGALALLILLVGLALARSRRRGKFVGILAVAIGVAGATFGASSASADTTQNLDLAIFKPAPSIEAPMLSVEDGVVGASGAWSIGLAFDHAANPLMVRAVGEEREDDIPITGRTATNLMFTYAFLDRFEGGLSLPFLRQTGNMPGFSGIEPPEGLAIGDLQVHFKAAIAKFSKISLAASTAITAPTASQDRFAGIRAPGVHVRGIASLSSGRVGVAANLGANIRGTNSFGGADQGSALTYGLAAEYRMSPAVSFVGEVFGVLGLGGGAVVSPIESAGGIRYRLTRSLSLRMGGAAGISSGIGASKWRGFAVLSFASGASTIDKFEEVKLRPTPNDQDGDGIEDLVDECIDEPEDVDMFDDKDGCPDWDNDGDGLDDSLDKCPLRAEDKDNHEDEDGCPDNDNDGDKVADKDDKCPNEPEDLDGFEDLDGCDDPDNDKDGVPDVIDGCVLEPETINGNKDDDGCPDDGDPLVMLMADRLEVFEPIRFRGNSARLTKKSAGVVDQVSATLRAQPIITKLRIAVHLHPTNGDDDALSKRRAKVIFDRMLRTGIAPERLEMKGFGSDQLLVPETQRGAKQINDRVEFVILEKGI